ncbi:MAG: WYL domain-containing protein [Bacteroidetes bacterium]|jgi:hypothetical protein|nr:WYL domain-containing protein [Bacteroidota bacterium]
MSLFGTVIKWITGDEGESGYSHSARICDDCGSTLDVHRYHITPIQNGGSESESNIIILCEECQEEEHSFKFEKNHWIVGKKTALPKYQLIKNAIETNGRLSITYLTGGMESKKAKREIDPLILIREDYSFDGGGGGYRMYLRAFCHLRRAMRTFRVGRIKTIETVSK